MLAAIVDYGSGNLRSVAKALERVGATTLVASSPAEVEAADLLVLPGVGAFGDCVGNLHARGWWEPIAAWLRAERPFLGICLGYQLLFESSEESPATAGFGRFRGHVRRFDSTLLKVPQIGWNRITPVHPADPLWHDLGPDPHVYFVHSFYPEPADPATVAATCDYGIRFAAAVSGPGPLLATQFHPEKSQRAGLGLLRNFLAQVPVAAAPDQPLSPA